MYFTEATCAEPGNLFFDWSRSLDDISRRVDGDGWDAMAVITVE